VTYLDRAAESAENVFSDDQNLVTVRPRFLLYRSDALNVDVKVPDSTVLDELLERLKYNTATVMRMTLSPEIAGYHTLTLQGQTSTYFYMLGVNAEQGVHGSGFEIQQHPFKPAAERGQTNSALIGTQHNQTPATRATKISLHVAHEDQTAVVGQQRLNMFAVNETHIIRRR
jgi:hypothetical protein